MKYLALVLLLCPLMSMSNAQCSHKPLTQGTTHCRDNVDMIWHAVGSFWRNSACMDCSCTECCAGRFPDECLSKEVMEWSEDLN